MLYAIIMRFDSLREIEAAMTAEVRKSRGGHQGGIKVHSVIHARSTYGRFACPKNEGVHCDVKFTSADFDMPMETIVAIYRRRW